MNCIINYTGADNRLILEGVGPLDTVYLRAGYQYSDYEAFNIDEQECCQALMATRVFIEQHRVAVNATVGQQLATSKRVQMLLAIGLRRVCRIWINTAGS